MREKIIEDWVRKNTTITFVRSRGPGGQNVNKVSTKAVARLVLSDMSVLSHEEKGLVRNRLRNRINSSGEIVLSSQKYRSQLKNRMAVSTRMAHLIASALKRRTRRILTRPRQRAVEQRLRDKKRVGEKKRLRRSLLD